MMSGDLKNREMRRVRSKNNDFRGLCTQKVPQSFAA